MDLSIIVPVYNVEKYVRSCLESIFQQGLDEKCYEVIIVNDGTTDRSMEVIRDIIEKHSNVTVIEQTNQGLSAARNNGLTKAVGDYILFVDSDDLLITNTLVNFLDDIREKKPEMLIAGFIRMTDEEILNGQMPEQTEYSSLPKPMFMATIELLNPRECYVWRTIYNRYFLYGNAIHFIHGIYFEDIPFSAECYLKARKCIVTPYIFYIYRQRPDSIVSTISMKKILDFNTIIARLWRMRNKVSSGKEYTKLMNLIFNTHQLQNWFITHDKELLAERKKTTKDLQKKVPGLYFYGGIIERTETFLYQHMPNVYLFLKSLLK